MSWLARLYETYEEGMRLPASPNERLMPIGHTLQNAHINIVLDVDGNFKRASVLEKTQVVLPATESSAGRSSGEAPHPLADKLQYVAADYPDFGGKKPGYFESYCSLLQSWCDSAHQHPKALAVLRYVKKRSVIKDLVRAKVCHLDASNVLQEVWGAEDGDLPLLFKVLPKDKGNVEQGNALVCWSVEAEGDSCFQTWKRVFIILCQPSHRSMWASSRPGKCIDSCESVRFQF